MPVDPYGNVTTFNPRTSGGINFPSYGGAGGGAGSMVMPGTGQYGGGAGLGLPPGQGAGAYGAVPTVPNPINTASSAIGGDVGNLGGISTLTGGLGAANASAAQAAVGAGLPGYAGLLGQASGNIASDLAGQVNPDVMNLIQQTAAERGISTGSPGSPNANAAMLRALGLTSMGLQSHGQQELSAAVARTPTGVPVDASRFVVTPDQMQEASYMQSLFNAAPNPALKAKAEEDALMRQIAAGQSATGGGTRPWAGYPGTNVTGGRGAGGPTDALGFPITPGGDGGYNPAPSPWFPATGAPATTSSFDYNQWLSSLPGGSPSEDVTSVFDPTSSSYVDPSAYGAGAPAGTGYNPYTDQSTAPLQFPDYSTDYGS